KDPALHTATSVYDVRGNRLTYTDGDSGTTTYTYDALGEVLSRVGNAANDEVDYAYDVLGRPLSATAAAGSIYAPNSTWTYDTRPNGIGKLATSGTGTGTGYTSRVEWYDAYGRPNATSTTVDGTSYPTNTGFDSSGRVAWKSY